MARVLNSTELGYLRRDGQQSRLYLAIHTPATVFQARVNQASFNNDGLTQLTYDTPTGSYLDVAPDMTLYVGSAPGLYDYGQCRIRKDATSSILYVGETAEIAWADNLYLTVVDEFGLWQKHLRVDDSGNAWMDYDIAYSDQHAACDPTPVLQPHAVAWLTGATVTVTFNASSSWAVGSTITGYSWTAPGCASISGAATATPTITYNAAGTYRVACLLTAANGKTFTGYRYVFVFDTAHPPVTQFRLDSCAGDWMSGGWMYRATLYGEAARSSLRDRSMCILFTKDWYGATEISLGPISGRENILAIGWLDAESIVRDPEAGTVSFEVKGPHFWLGAMLGFPVGVEDVSSTAAKWTQMQTLTVDKMMWHFLHWQSTATRCLDIQLSGDTRRVRGESVPFGSAWQQLAVMAEATIFAHPACDRYGRLYIEVDSPLLSSSGKGSIPVVQDILTTDWRETVAITRSPAQTVGQLIITGVAYSPGNSIPMGAISPGQAPAHWGGRNERRDRLALISQAETITVCGRLAGQLNNPYPAALVQLASNHRDFDICPHQYGRMSLAIGDTPRGIVWSNQKLIPRRVTYTNDLRSGTLLTDVEFEADSLPQNAAYYRIPSYPGTGNFPIPVAPTPPPWPTLDSLAALAVDYNGGVYATTNLLATYPHWFKAQTGLGAGMYYRQSAVLSPTTGKFYVLEYKGSGFVPTLYSGNLFDIAKGAGMSVYYPGIGTPSDPAALIGWSFPIGECSRLFADPLTDGALMYAISVFSITEERGVVIVRHLDPATDPVIANEGVLYATGEVASCSFGTGEALLSTIGELATPPYYAPMLLRSSNGGNTFSLLNLLASAGDPLLHVRSGKSLHVFVWGAAESYYSSDAGASLSGAGQLFYGQARAVAMQTGGGNCLGINQSGALLRSSDYGATWTLATTPGTVSCVIELPGYNGLVWMAGGAGLWLTTDFGATWLNRAGDIPISDIREIFAVPTR